MVLNEKGAHEIKVTNMAPHEYPCLLQLTLELPIATDAQPTAIILSFFDNEINRLVR